MRRRDRLDSLQVISPCPVAWSSMEGTDEVRFCGKCRKNVYNVAAMTRAEALAVIERAEGRVCMQLTRRPDGTIATGDCWAALRRARRRGLIAFAVAVPAIVLAQLWSQAFGLRALSGFLRRPPPPAAALMIPELPPIETAPEPEPVLKGEISIERPRTIRGKTSIVLGRMAAPSPPKSGR
jgi:hypothetical protein